MGQNEEESQRITPKRVVSLLLAFVLLCVGGGVALSGFFVPAIAGINTAASVGNASLNTETVSMELTRLPQQSQIYASDGKTVIARFYDQNRIVVPLKDISEYMQKAVVAREDHRFLEHSGVDVQGIARAFVETYIKRGSTQGGSTLTQQYVKNALLDQAVEQGDPIAAYHAREDTLARKFREMLIAQQLEQKYSKAQILQGYLNIAQFGVNTYGVETAAERYFSKPAKDLTLGEAATIAAITKNPNRFDPTVNPAEAQKQRNIVLGLMAEYGFASKAAVDAAKKVPMSQMLHVKQVPVGCETAGNAAFFCNYVVRSILLSPKFGKTVQERRQLLYNGGLKIYTTLNLQAQQAAWNAVTQEIPVTDPSGTVDAIAAVQPGTGKILAMAQNKNYGASSDDSNNDTTFMNYAVDQEYGGGSGFGIGSTFKPINFVAWLMAGKKINTPLVTHTAYPVDSFPCAKKTGKIWYVQNAGGGTVSPETPLHALNFSHNTTQASMAQIIGLCAIANAATDLGYHNAIESQSNIHSTITPTMIIGTLNTSPLTMANVYATIAANGVECNPIAITKVIDANGKEMSVPPASCHQAIPANVAQTTAYAMNLNVTQGIASAAQLAGGRKTFAKTGTNQNATLATGGFVPQVSAFVIVANPQHPTWLSRTIAGRTESQWYGSDLALPTWKNFMQSYLDSAKVPIDNNYGNPDPSML